MRALYTLLYEDVEGPLEYAAHGVRAPVYVVRDAGPTLARAVPLLGDILLSDRLLAADRARRDYVFLHEVGHVRRSRLRALLFGCLLVAPFVGAAGVVLGTYRAAVGPETAALVPGLGLLGPWTPLLALGLPVFVLGARAEEFAAERFVARQLGPEAYLAVHPRRGDPPTAWRLRAYQAVFYPSPAAVVAAIESGGWLRPYLRDLVPGLAAG